MRHGELAVVGTDDDASPERQTPRERVLEAMIAVVEADDENEDAYRAAWERFRAAAKAWLDDTRANPGSSAGSGSTLRRAFQALALLQRPLGSHELSQGLGVSQRSAQEMLDAMRKAGLPLRTLRLRSDSGRVVRHALRMTTAPRCARCVATAQLWLPSMAGSRGPGAM